MKSKCLIYKISISVLFSLNSVILMSQNELLVVEGGIKMDSMEMSTIPAFRAELTVDFDVTAFPNDTLMISSNWEDSPIVEYQSVFDNGNNFDSFLGVFTAPRTGLYFFELSWIIRSNHMCDDIIHSFISVNNSVSDNCIKNFATLFSCGNTNSYPDLFARVSKSSGGILRLNQGDTVGIQLAYLDQAGFNNLMIEKHSSFSGYLIADLD